MVPYRNLGVALVWLGLAAGGFAADCPRGQHDSPDRERFETYDRQAQVEFRHGNFEKAAVDFGRAACFSTQSLAAVYELLESAASALVTNDFAHAASTLKDADQREPGSALSLAMLVKVELLAGNLDDLKASLRELAARFPRDGKLHAGLTQDLVQANRFDLALAEGLRFEQSGSQDARATLNLAVLENQAGALGDAVRGATSLEEQSELPSKIRASGAAIAGLSYESLGQLPQAISQLQRAIELDPDEPNPYLALARIYGEQQNSEQALAVLEQAERRISNSRQILLALGSAQVAADRFAAARESLTGLLERFPDELEAYLKLAAAYRNLGEPVLATQTLRRLAVRQSGYPRLHVVIAESMLDENPVDYPGVMDELAKAEKAYGEDYDVLYLKGRVYLAIRKYEQAVAALQRAITVRPTDPGAHYQLGMAYRKSGRDDLAREQFARMESLKGN
jgi:tetratricopeptide (TPR) repeat protein